MTEVGNTRQATGIVAMTKVSKVGDNEVRICDSGASVHMTLLQLSCTTLSCVQRKVSE